MFESQGRRARRPLDPPVDVKVNLRVLLPGANPRRGKGVPSWIRVAGIQTRDPVPGMLSAWLLTGTGAWLGEVVVLVRIDGQLRETPMLVPARAIKPVDTDT